MRNLLQTTVALALLLSVAFTTTAQTVTPSIINVASPATGLPILIHVAASPMTTYSITSKPDWITFVTPPPTSGTGDFTIESIDDNYSKTNSRSGNIVIEFNGGASSTTVVINQQPSPATITLSETAKMVPSNFGVYDLTISSDADWTATCTSTGDWFRFYPGGLNKSGTAGNNIALQYDTDNNVPGVERTGTITFTAGITSATLTITQEVTTDIFNGSESEQQFSVYPNPSNGIVYIESKTPLSIKIFESKGSVIGVGEAATRHSFELPKGLYLIQTEDNHTQKLIVE